MTGVPAPRDERASTGETPLLTYVANTVGRLEESVAAGFREVRDQLAEMPRTYVSQREFDRTRDDIVIEVGQVRVDQERADRAICEQIADLRRRAEAEGQERQRKEEALAAERLRRDEAAAADAKTARRARIALAVSSGIALAGTAIGFLHH